MGLPAETQGMASPMLMGFAGLKPIALWNSVLNKIVPDTIQLRSAKA